MARYWGEEELAAGRQLRAEGLSWAAIGQQLGVSPETARYRLDDEFRTRVRAAQKRAGRVATEDDRFAEPGGWRGVKNRERAHRKSVAEVEDDTEQMSVAYAQTPAKKGKIPGGDTPWDKLDPETRKRRREYARSMAATPLALSIEQSVRRRLMAQEEVDEDDWDEDDEIELIAN